MTAISGPYPVTHIKPATGGGNNANISGFSASMEMNVSSSTAPIIQQTPTLSAPLDKDSLPLFGPNQQEQQKQYMKQQLAQQVAQQQLRQSQTNFGANASASGTALGMMNRAGSSTSLSASHRQHHSNADLNNANTNSLGKNSPTSTPRISSHQKPASSSALNTTATAAPSPKLPKQKIADLCTAEIRRTNQIMIPRAKGIAENICTNMIERYLMTNEDENYVNKMMRKMSDEYYLACSEFAAVCQLPPNFASRFGELQDEYHELIRFGNGAGQQERYNSITQAVAALEKEVQKILLPAAVEILGCTKPSNKSSSKQTNNNNTELAASLSRSASGVLGVSENSSFSLGGNAASSNDALFSSPDNNNQNLLLHVQQKELSQSLANVTMISHNTFIDTGHNLVIQKWDSCHKGARRYCKSLQKLASAWLNHNFCVPYCVVMEICGVTFSATAVAPLCRPMRDITAFAEWCLSIEAITSERGFPVERREDLTHNCRFATGADGKVYCYHAAGLMMPTFNSALEGAGARVNGNLEMYQKKKDAAYSGTDGDRLDLPSSQLIDAFEGVIEDTNEEQEELFAKSRASALEKVVDAVRTKQVGMSKQQSIGGPLRTLKDSGLEAKDITVLFSQLYEKDAQLKKTAAQKGVKPKKDRDLQDALIATLAEILARVLRIIIRECWADNYPRMIAKIRQQLRKSENLNVEALNNYNNNDNNNESHDNSPMSGKLPVKGMMSLNQSQMSGGAAASGGPQSSTVFTSPSLIESVDPVMIQMSVFTHQLVELLLIEGSSARPNPQDQLYLHIVELAKKVFPERSLKFNDNRSSRRNNNNNNTSSISTFFKEPVNTTTFNETLLNIVHVAEHLADKLGMTFSDGILCFSQRSLGRVTRSTTLTAPKSWFRSAVAGNHKDNLKLMATKLQNAANSTRPDLPDSFPFFIALRQCDFVHQAQDTPGVPPTKMFMERNVAPLIPQPDDDDDDSSSSDSSNDDGEKQNENKKKKQTNGDGGSSDDDMFQDVGDMKNLAEKATKPQNKDNNNDNSTTNISLENINQTCFSHFLRFAEAMQKVSYVNSVVASIAATTTPGRISLAVSARHILATQFTKPGEKPQFDALNVSTITQGSLPGAPLSNIPKNMTSEMWKAEIAIVEEMNKEIEKALKDVRSFLAANEECRKLFDVAGKDNNDCGFSSSSSSSISSSSVPSAFVSGCAMLSALMQNKVRLLVNIAKEVCHETVFLEYYRILRDLDQLSDKGIITKSCATVSFISIMDSAVALYIHPLTHESQRKTCISFSKQKVDFAAQLFGENSVQWAAAVADIGALNMKLGDLEAARTSYEKAFTRLREIAPNHSTTLAAANNLGCILFRLAHTKMNPVAKRKRLATLHFKFPQDVDSDLVDAVYALQYVVLRSTHADAKTLSDTFSNIGSICVYRARYGKALPYFEEALKLTRGLMSDTHPERASIIRNRIMCEKRIQAAASVRIACLFRMFVARKEVARKRKLRDAAIVIQCVGRGFLVRQRPKDERFDFFKKVTVVSSPNRNIAAGNVRSISPTKLAEPQQQLRHSPPENNDNNKLSPSRDNTANNNNTIGSVNALRMSQLSTEASGKSFEATSMENGDKGKIAPSSGDGSGDMEKSLTSNTANSLTSPQARTAIRLHRKGGLAKTPATTTNDGGVVKTDAGLN